MLQSSVFDAHARRVVAPLVLEAHAGARHALLNPKFVVDGTAVVLLPFDVASVPVAELGKPVASLRRHGDKLVGAIDQLITRVYD